MARPSPAATLVNVRCRDLRPCALPNPPMVRQIICTESRPKLALILPPFYACAHKSALNDRRFSPIEPSELSSLDVSVSLLVEYEPARHWEDWEVWTRFAVWSVQCGLVQRRDTAPHMQNGIAVHENDENVVAVTSCQERLALVLHCGRNLEQLWVISVWAWGSVNHWSVSSRRCVSCMLRIYPAASATAVVVGEHICVVAHVRHRLLIIPTASPPPAAVLSSPVVGRSAWHCDQV